MKIECLDAADLSSHVEVYGLATGELLVGNTIIQTSVFENDINCFAFMDYGNDTKPVLIYSTAMDIQDVMIRIAEMEKNGSEYHAVIALRDDDRKVVGYMIFEDGDD